MSDAELLEQLQQYIGYRVRINSAVVHQQWTELQDVKLLPNGIWCYGQDGLAWLVSSDGLEVEVEPIEGGYDNEPLSARLEAIANAVEAYGSTPTEQRQWCHCNICQPKHDAEEAERLQQLQELVGGATDEPPAAEDKKADTGGPKSMFEGF